MLSKTLLCLTFNKELKSSNIIKMDQSNYSKCEKIYIHTYAIIEFAKHYKVSIDWLCGKKKNRKLIIF